MIMWVSLWGQLERGAETVTTVLAAVPSTGTAARSASRMISDGA